MRRLVRPALFLVVALAAVAAFVVAGRFGGEPLRWSDPGGWLARVDPTDALVEFARLVGLVLAGYVAVVSAMVLVAESAGLVRLSSVQRLVRRVAGWVAVPALRRRLVELSAVASVTVGSLSSVAVPATHPSTVATLDVSHDDSAALPAAFFVAGEPDVVARGDGSWAVVRVKAGDTLWGIVARHYGRADSELVWRVAEASGLENPGQIAVGQMLSLPPMSDETDLRSVHDAERVDSIARATASTVGELSVVSPQAEQSVTVVSGDTVWRLAETRLDAADGPDREPSAGAVAAYVRDVVAANAFASGDPDLIFPGEVLQLPALGDSPIVEPAVLPAPTVVSDSPALPDRVAPVVSPPVVASAQAPVPSLPPPTLTPPLAPADAVEVPPAHVVPVATTTGSPADLASVPTPHNGHGLPDGWIEALAGATVLASGLMVLVRRRRGVRQGYSVADSTTAGPGPSPVEIAVSDAADVDLVRWAGLVLGELGAQLDPADVVGGPAGVELDTDSGPLEPHWTQPNPVPAAGWEARDGGWSWYARFDASLVLRELAPPLPSLVSVGSRGGRLVLVDLEEAGSLAVSGEPVRVGALLRSLVLELASGDHLSDAFVVTVGSDLSSLAHLDRVRSLDVDDAAELIKRSVDDCADMVGDTGSLFRARLGGAASVASPATVVVAAGLRSDERDRLVAATAPGRGAALVVEGPVDHAGAQLYVDGASGLLVGLAGQRLRLDPVGVPSSTAHALCGWLDRELTGSDATPVDSVAGLVSRVVAPDRSEDRAVAAPANAAVSVSAARDANVVEPLRRFTLRVFGAVVADGASTQALAVPYVIAFARRPMSSAELAEITGYSLRTFSTVFTTDHPLVRRIDGRLVLRDGVWTDHGWIAECVRQAASAVAAGDTAAALRWLHDAITEGSKITGAPFESTPPHRMKRDPYAWVDDFPVDVSARARAGQELVEAVLAAVELWMVTAAADVVSPSQLAGLCCRLAQLVPYAPVAVQVRPSQWSAGESLLVAGYRVASGDPGLSQAVQARAKRLVATGVLEASDVFADEIGL